MVDAVITLYLNVFVGIVQAFEKVPTLHVMAPTQTEPPFKLTQLVALTLFILPLPLSPRPNFAPGPRSLSDKIDIVV